MLYLPEVPRDGVLSDFYSGYGEFKRYEVPRGVIARLRARLEAMRDLHVRMLEETGGVKQLRVLEIGASVGHFCERARMRGARVTAVEPDGASRAHLAARGVEALDRIPADREFDVVCAFQVLEHLTDPGAMLAQVAAVIPRDGRALLSVPNAGEFDDTGPTWIGFRVDLEHLNYFRAEHLARLCALHGLFVEHQWQTAQPAVGRAGTPPAPLARRLWSKVFESTRITRSGSYELSVLARRA